MELGSMIDSVDKYLEELQELADSHNDVRLFFRGQTQKGAVENSSFKVWNPSPSIFRGNRIKHENEYYSYAMTECATEFGICKNHCEILSTMQHYGIPTRLLDITSNALVALFFACISEGGDVNSKEPGVVHVIASDKWHIKEYDSDIVTILSSLPRFTMNEKRELQQLAQTARELENSIECFNGQNNKQVRRLLHEIKKEKPAFEPIIQPEQLLSNYICTPQKTNQRIIKQSGAFILFGLGDKVLPNSENAGFENFPYVIKTISVENKPQIVKTLELCGISLATMFPELYKVAEYLKKSKLDI